MFPHIPTLGAKQRELAYLGMVLVSTLKNRLKILLFSVTTIFSLMAMGNIVAKSIIASMMNMASQILSHPLILCTQLEIAFQLISTPTMRKSIPMIQKEDLN